MIEIKYDAMSKGQLSKTATLLRAKMTRNYEAPLVLIWHCYRWGIRLNPIDFKWVCDAMGYKGPLEEYFGILPRQDESMRSFLKAMRRSQKGSGG